MNKNHLVPEMIVDLVKKAEIINKGQIESFDTGMYLARIEAIRDYCDSALSRLDKRKKVSK